MVPKVRKWFLGGLTGLLLLQAACRPEHVIPSGEMEVLFAEFYLADACIESRNEAAPDAMINPDSLHVYLPILEKHGFTDTMFQASLDYYLHRPHELVSIFKRVRVRLEKAVDFPPVKPDIERMEVLTEEEASESEEETGLREGSEPEIERKSAPEQRTKKTRKRMTRNDLKRLEEELK